MGESLLGRDGSIWIFVQGYPEFLVTPLLMGPFCLLSQGRLKGQSAPKSKFTLRTVVVSQMGLVRCA